MLVVQIVLARLLAPEAFGALAIMLVVVEVCNTVSQSGMGQALIQRKNATDIDCDTAMVLSLGLAIALYAVVFALSPLVAAFYEMDGLSAYLRVLALVVPVNAFNSIQRSLLQKEMDFKSIFKANMAAVLVSGALGIALAAAGFGVWALVAQVLVQALLACAVMLVFVPWRPRLRFDAMAAKSLFGFGWKIMATGILNVVYTGVSELILGKVCKASDLGLYSQGRKWPNAGISVLSNALQNVMFPAFAELQDDVEGLKAAIRRALASGSFVVVPLSLLLAASAQPLVALLLTEKWLGCVPVFQLTCLSGCVLIMQLVNLRAYMALGDSGLYLRLQVVKVALLCAAIWPTALLTHDINLTALANTIAGIVCVLIVDLPPARRMHGVGAVEQLSVLLPILIAAMAAAAPTWAITLVGLPHAATLVSQIAAFAVVYLLIARLFRLPGSSDISALARSALGRAS